MYAGKLIFSQRQFSDSFLWGFRLRSFHLRNDSTDHAQYLYRAHSGRFRVSALRDLLVTTLTHNKHLRWEDRILDDPLYSRPPTHSITQLNLNNPQDSEERKRNSTKQ